MEANTAIAYKAEDQREESSKDSKPRKSLEALSCMFSLVMALHACQETTRKKATENIRRNNICNSYR